MNYSLNVGKIKELSLKAGIRTIGELCERANIHKNSITPYLKGHRSPFTQVVTDLAEALKVPVPEIIWSGEDQVISQVKTRLAPLAIDGSAIFLFGSRARRTERKFSDIDLGVTGGKVKLDFAKFSIFKSKVEDAFDNYPLTLNLVCLDLAPVSFLTEIAPDLTFICGDENAANFFLGYLDGRKENQGS